MSILINGMEMPQSGYVDVRLFSDGRATTQTGEHPFYREMDIIEVSPHGRLIDADILYKKFCSHCDDYMSGKDECKEGCFDLKIIKSMPTVIPADKDGEI